MPQWLFSRSIFALFLIALSAHPLAAQQAQPHRLAELERVVMAELEETKTPGAVVAIVQGDRILYSKGFGVANVETQQPVTAEMLFPIASMTKMYTAAALVALAEEGKLDLKAPIGRYLEGLPPRLASLTTHQLLSHTAGLMDGGTSGWRFDDRSLGQEVATYKDSQFFTEPGAIFSYANPGFIIAGLLVEKASGKPYTQFVRERITVPLGMDRTVFHTQMVMTYPFTQTHLGQEGQPATVMRPMGLIHHSTWPAGGLFSNVNDLARFAIAFMHGGVLDGKQALPDSVFKRMSTPVAPVHSQIKGGSYGYGLMTHERRGVHLVEHGGTLTGSTSDFIMAPQQRVAVIVLANRRSHLTRTVDKALELVLPFKQELQEAKMAAFTPAELSDYVGRYAQGQGSTIEVVSANGGLELKSQGGGQLALTRLAPDVFSVRIPGFTDPLRLAFVRGADGRVHYLHNRLRALKRVP
jgi:CubicO group peptidase (beta-lactamase class C family)